MKSRCLKEMARTTLNENPILKSFWANVVDTTCYLMNRALIKSNLNKMLYDSILEGNQIFLSFISLDVNVMFITTIKTT